MTNVGVFFLKRCDIIPILLPNNIAVAKELVNEIQSDGILLTGGNDSSERFIMENFLIDYAIKNKVPMLGVCHGMQAIQRYFNIVLSEVSGHVTEEIEILVNKMPRIVNSYQTLGTVNTAPELNVWAKANDGLIKAIRHQTFPITGIMWHPERFTSFKNEDIVLFQSIFKCDFVAEHRSQQEVSL